MIGSATTQLFVSPPETDNCRPPPTRRRVQGRPALHPAGHRGIHSSSALGAPSGAGGRGRRLSGQLTARAPRLARARLGSRQYFYPSQRTFPAAHDGTAGTTQGLALVAAGLGPRKRCHWHIATKALEAVNYPIGERIKPLPRIAHRQLQFLASALACKHGLRDLRTASAQPSFIHEDDRGAVGNARQGVVQGLFGA